jgi:hypothetical protein
MMLMLARHGRSRRRAAAAIWALVAMTTMLMALALSLNAGWLATARQELGSASDAAALAGANELMSDAWLRQGKPGVATLLQEARDSARAFGARNRVLGQPLELEIRNLNSRDVVLGSYDPATPKTLTAADLSDPASLTLDDVNTVAVTGTRARERGTGVPMLFGALILQPFVDMRVNSLAYLDRDVIGFRAREANPIPLVPIGVRSDPAGTNARSWENQIVARNGPDDYHYDADGSSFTQRGDLIPEIVIELQLGPNGDPSQSNATLLTIGTGLPSSQVTGGITERHLISRDGRLALGPSNSLTLPASGVGPEAGTAEYLELVNALKQLRDNGTARVWPLVSEVAAGKAAVNAFVAARVVRIEEQGGGPLRIRLQPTLMAVPHAITDFSRRATAHLLPSEYLARPRLAR